MAWKYETLSHLQILVTVHDKYYFDLKTENIQISGRNAETNIVSVWWYLHFSLKLLVELSINLAFA
jgi:hypothetical protein